uniref:Uncharacterized protein n=1 Tax=Arundo donax TaxID=35708 RepID=A0A0A9DEB7_ARUDO
MPSRDSPQRCYSHKRLESYLLPVLCLLCIIIPAILLCNFP